MLGRQHSPIPRLRARVAPRYSVTRTRSGQNSRQGGNVIIGEKVTGQTKQAIAADIAKAIGASTPRIATGSSVESSFLDVIHQWRTGRPNPGTDANRKVERVLDAFDLTYDPYWDTSESTDSGGGSTVTTRAYSRIRSAITGVPRCFIFKVNDAPIGSRWETNHNEVYRYGSNVTARKALNDAGPGSQVIYYATRKASKHRRHYVASATVAYIASGWEGPWEARLENYSEFNTPVPFSYLTLPGDNPQNAITEISFATYNQLVVAAGNPAIITRPLLARVDSEDGVGDDSDLGGPDVARRIIKDFPIDVSSIHVDIPPALPQGAIPVVPPKPTTYSESPTGALESPTLPPRSGQNNQANRLAEERAIDIVKAVMVQDGWTVHADRQKDGTGYDLEFDDGSRILKVEVKGVRGSNLAFNLTPKEFWRAETDPDWVVMVVTNVLSASAYKVNLLTRDKIVSASRQVTGFRLSVDG